MYEPWKTHLISPNTFQFLWDTFKANYTLGKYLFTFLACHMLTMSFVCFHIWQIKQTCPSDFENGLVGFGIDIEKAQQRAGRKRKTRYGRPNLQGTYAIETTSLSPVIL
jgi:hypothetical protein